MFLLSRSIMMMIVVLPCSALHFSTEYHFVTIHLISFFFSIRFSIVEVKSISPVLNINSSSSSPPDDDQGQLGLGESSQKNYSIPRFSSFNVQVISISCGYAHSGFIAQNGYIYMMGNEYIRNTGGRRTAWIEALRTSTVEYTPNLCCTRAFSNADSLSLPNSELDISPSPSSKYHLLTFSLLKGSNLKGQLGINSISIKNCYSPSLVETLQK